jgi:hypothetical protein
MVKLSVQQAVKAHRTVRYQGSRFPGQSANRWRCDCQPYVSAALYSQEDSWYSFLLEA